ncbi:hypothetical protein RUND412_006199 [Rhizina undulata]
MPSLCITGLPAEILINIMTNLDSSDELDALMEAHPMFIATFNCSPISILNSLVVRQFEKLFPCYGKRLFDLSWRIICLDRLNPAEHTEYQELKSLPPARPGGMTTHVSEAYGQVILKPNSYWIRLLNSHPGGIVAFTEEDIQGRLVYYSLRLTEYLMEAKYYEMAREINKDLIKGRAHPCRTYWEKFSYKELYCLYRAATRLVEIPSDVAMCLRDCLIRKRDEEGIEKVWSGLLYFPEWWHRPGEQPSASAILNELFGEVVADVTFNMWGNNAEDEDLEELVESNAD